MSGHPRGCRFSPLRAAVAVAGLAMVAGRDVARDAADGGVHCCRVVLQRRRRGTAARVRGRILIICNRVSRNSALWWRVPLIRRRPAPRLDGVSRVCDAAGALGPDLGDSSAQPAGDSRLCGVHTVGHPTLGRSHGDTGLAAWLLCFPLHVCQLLAACRAVYRAPACIRQPLDRRAGLRLRPADGRVICTLALPG